ncbi:MAG: hypothetical protein AB7K24_01525 [Gemmataceae bacterium]
MRSKIAAFVAARAMDGVDLSKADVNADFLRAGEQQISGELGPALRRSAGRCQLS